jgi:hypothetical protein
MAFYGKIRAKGRKVLHRLRVLKFFSSFGWKALVTNQGKVSKISASLFVIIKIIQTNCELFQNCWVHMHPYEYHNEVTDTSQFVVFIFDTYDAFHVHE